MIRTTKRTARKIYRMYRSMDRYFGNLAWWPAETPFEVIAGAVLTQNTAWPNVEKALDSLRAKGLLDPESIIRTDGEELGEIIRSSGFFRQKSARLKSVSRYLYARGRDWHKVLAESPAASVRQELLNIKGIGKETADSILLYALEKKVFVVDNYTKRILTRHFVTEKGIKYDQVQRIIQESVPAKIQLYKQFHALFVETAKNFCRKSRPLCGECPLRRFKREIKEEEHNYGRKNSSNSDKSRA